MAGTVLCSLNTRHDSAMVSVLLKHSEANIIFVDYQLLDVARGALKILSKASAKLPCLILISDSESQLSIIIIIGAWLQKIWSMSAF